MMCLVCVEGISANLQFNMSSFYHRVKIKIIGGIAIEN